MADCKGKAALVAVPALSGGKGMRVSYRGRVAERYYDTAKRQRQKHAVLVDKLPGAGAIRYVEAFQISEYGRQPTVDEIRKLFPFAD